MHQASSRGVHLPLRVLSVAAFVLTATNAWGASAARLDGVLVSAVDAGWSIAADGLGVIHVTQNAVVNARRIDVPDSSVVLVTWDELAADGSTVPFYAVSLDGHNVQTVRDTSYDLKLRYEEFDPLLEAAVIPPALTNPDSNIYIVQFETQPLNAFRRQLEALGTEIYKFLANHAYIVRMTTQTRAAVEQLPYVRWVGVYESAYRLEAELLGVVAGGDSLPEMRYNIQVFERGERQQREVGDRIEALGGRVELIVPLGFRMEAWMTSDQLLEVVAMDQVLFIDRWTPAETDMDLVREFGGADFVEDMAGFDGTGVRGEVMDGNVRETHVDFQLKPLLLHGSKSGDPNHGTSTTGIIFGEGIGRADARGMLPNGRGIFADFNFLTDRHRHTAELVQPPYRAVFQSNSWGSTRTRDYTTVSSEMDDIIFINDIVITQSQSNAGSQLSRPQAWAKNVVSVGGVFHRNTLDTSDDCWCSGASIGPAADGRIKPDLSHWYDRILTLSGGSNTSYTSGFNGTSAAAPIVAGHFGVFFEMWHREVFPGRGGAGGVFLSRPHMTTARAMVINTARQYDFQGLSDDLTRVHQGWGQPDLRNMYNLREKIMTVDEEVILTELQSQFYQLEVEPGEPEFRATLIWADPAGTTSSNQHRINDLTLKVLSPSGVSYRGNKGLKRNTHSVEGSGSGNHIDTVENVWVLDPEPGTWTVEVFADEINEDGHVETPEIDADFALVVSGVVTGCGFEPADVNCDGSVDAFDIEALIDLLFGGGVPCSPCAGDVNVDGVVDAFDIEPFIDCLFNGNCP